MNTVQFDREQFINVISSVLMESVENVRKLFVGTMASIPYWATVSSDLAPKAEPAKVATLQCHTGDHSASRTASVADDD